LFTWNWWREPLIIDIDGEMTVDSYNTVRNSFEKRDPSISIFLAYDHDLTHSHWTTRKPSSDVFARIINYAKQTYEVIKSRLLPIQVINNLDNIDTFNSKKNWNIIFATVYDDYDVLLHIDSSVCPRYKASSYSSLASFYSDITELSMKSGNAGCKGYLIGFDPLQILFETLQERFSNLATFYYSFQGKTISIIWKTKAFALYSNDIGLPPSSFIHRMPLIQEGRVMGLVPNILAILLEMRNIGKNMITDITIQ